MAKVDPKNLFTKSWGPERPTARKIHQVTGVNFHPTWKRGATCHSIYFTIGVSWPTLFYTFHLGEWKPHQDESPTSRRICFLLTYCWWVPEIRRFHQLRLVVDIPLFTTGFIHPRWLFRISAINSSTWKLMVGRWVSLWEILFSGAKMLVSGSVCL